MDARHGSLDLEAMRAITRTDGRLPEGRWAALRRAYMRSGRWPGDHRISTTHASNALVALMAPGSGTYEMCVGPAMRGPAPMNPVSLTPIWGETNSFWSLQLELAPEDTVASAVQTAREDVCAAREHVDGEGDPAVRAWIEPRLDLAERELEDANGPRDAEPRRLGRQLRAATHAQVRARQVALCVSNR